MNDVKTVSNDEATERDFENFADEIGSRFDRPDKTYLLAALREEAYWQDAMGQDRWNFTREDFVELADILIRLSDRWRAWLNGPKQIALIWHSALEVRNLAKFNDPMSKRRALKDAEATWPRPNIPDEVASELYALCAWVDRGREAGRNVPIDEILTPIGEIARSLEIGDYDDRDRDYDGLPYDQPRFASVL